VITPAALLRELLDLDLVRRGERGAVALSGGGDSLCLLHLLAQLRDELGLELVAVHVDHGLRPESAEQARQVQAMARTLGVVAHVRQARLSGAPGNLQERAREERSRLLGELATDLSVDWVALGHTASDQAELVLMRAVRGAGVAGLGGMAWTTRMAPGTRLIRPLLGVTREAVGAYLARHGLQPVQDPSNETDRYFRNRVRRGVLPLLRRENPRVVETLCRLAQSCREEDGALEWAAAGILESARCADGLAVGPLRELPAGMLHRVLRAAHREATGSLRRLERGHLEELGRLLGSDGGTKGLDLPAARVERRYKRLVWLVEPAGPATFAPVVVDAPGRVVLGDGRALLVRICPTSDHRLALSAERAPFPLTVRPAAAGDRVAIGGGGSRKVSRVLMDAKVPLAERGRIPVVVSQEEVVLVVGLRRGHGRGPGPGEMALVVELEGGKRAAPGGI